MPHHPTWHGELGDPVVGGDPQRGAVDVLKVLLATEVGDALGRADQPARGPRARPRQGIAQLERRLGGR